MNGEESRERAGRGRLSVAPRGLQPGLDVLEQPRHVGGVARVGHVPLPGERAEGLRDGRGPGSERVQRAECGQGDEDVVPGAVAQPEQHRQRPRPVLVMTVLGDRLRRDDADVGRGVVERPHGIPARTDRRRLGRA